MPLDFQRRSRPSEQRVGRRAPPNYFSRQVQRRLLFMVGSLMLVLIIVPKVREPRFWDFLGFQRPIAGGPPLTSQEIVDRDIDTRLRPTSDPQPDEKMSAAKKNTRAPDALPPGGEATLSPLQLAEWDAWINVLGNLSGDHQLLVYAVLDHRLHGRSLSAADQEGWAELVRQLDERWTEHLSAARAVLNDLPAEEQSTWTGLLAELRQRWTEQMQPEMAAWLTTADRAGDKAGDGAGKDTTPAESDRVARQSLEARVQAALDVAIRAAIQDDMVQRPAEKAAWFRYFQEVREQDPGLLKSRSAGPTGFLPLYKQSADYRGKVVTVRGVVRLAYQVDAPPNRAGIASYYLLWIHPAGGPNSPLVVYCTELPAGFPAIKNKDRDRATTPLNEEVEITGIFFKRWAYESQGGIHVAPLLLARGPQWQARESSSAELTWTNVALLVISTAAGGSLVAWFLFKRAGDTNPVTHSSAAAPTSPADHPFA
ncbi:MAG: hypothetical protein ACKPEY_11025 [Planctomycetota bacterium]